MNNTTLNNLSVSDQLLLSDVNLDFYESLGWSINSVLAYRRILETARKSGYLNYNSISETLNHYGVGGSQARKVCTSASAYFTKEVAKT